MRFFRTFSVTALILIANVFAGSAALASDLERVTLDPMVHRDAVLTITDLSGDTFNYTAADLEAFPTYAIETTTPWRSEPARFEGVLLSDVLAHHGLDVLRSIEAIAENDFLTIMESEVWQTDSVLIATRVNGRPHSRRERGPMQIVIPSDLYQTNDSLEERHLVWMLAEIRPAQ